MFIYIASTYAMCVQRWWLSAADLEPASISSPVMWCAQKKWTLSNANRYWHGLTLKNAVRNYSRDLNERHAMTYGTLLVDLFLLGWQRNTPVWSKLIFTNYPHSPLISKTRFYMVVMHSTYIHLSSYSVSLSAVFTYVLWPG